MSFVSYCAHTDTHKLPTNRLVFNDNYSFKMGSNGCANLFHVFCLFGSGFACASWKTELFQNESLCHGFVFSLMVDQDPVPTLLSMAAPIRTHNIYMNVACAATKQHLNQILK